MTSAVVIVCDVRWQQCRSISGCRVHSRRLVRLRNRKCVRRKCHGGVRSSRGRYHQLPTRYSWYVLYRIVSYRESLAINVCSQSNQIKIYLTKGPQGHLHCNTSNMQ